MAAVLGLDSGATKTTTLRSLRRGSEETGRDLGKFHFIEPEMSPSVKSPIPYIFLRKKAFDQGTLLIAEASQQQPVNIFLTCEKAARVRIDEIQKSQGGVISKVSERGAHAP